MWKTQSYENRMDDGSRYDVALTKSGSWVAYYIQTGGRKAVPVKAVRDGRECDFATEFEAMMACECHRRGLVDEHMREAS